MSPFDYVRSINEKNYLYEDVDKNNYSSFIINKVLSFFPDTLFLVNEINLYSPEPKQHYDFLFHTVPKKKRYSKWIKTKKVEAAEYLMDKYKVRYERALEIAKVLSDEQIEEIKNKNNTGGKE